MMHGMDNAWWTAFHAGGVSAKAPSLGEPVYDHSFTLSCGFKMRGIFSSFFCRLFLLLLLFFFLQPKTSLPVSISLTPLVSSFLPILLRCRALQRANGKHSEMLLLLKVLELQVYHPSLHPVLSHPQSKQAFRKDATTAGVVHSLLLPSLSFENHCSAFFF